MDWHRSNQEYCDGEILKPTLGPAAKCRSIIFTYTFLLDSNEAARYGELKHSYVRKCDANCNCYVVVLTVFPSLNNKLLLDYGLKLARKILENLL